MNTAVAELSRTFAPAASLIGRPTGCPMTCTAWLSPIFPVGRIGHRGVVRDGPVEADEAPVGAGGRFDLLATDHGDAPVDPRFGTVVVGVVASCMRKPNTKRTWSSCGARTQ